MWPIPDESQFVVTRRARYFHVAQCLTYIPEEVKAILSREFEAEALVGQDTDIVGPRQEEPLDSDFFEDKRGTKKADDHTARGFWVHAPALASKRAADV